MPQAAEWRQPAPNAPNQHFAASNAAALSSRCYALSSAATDPLHSGMLLPATVPSMLTLCLCCASWACGLLPVPKPDPKVIDKPVLAPYCPCTPANPRLLPTLR